jgi:uncharacterized protein (TIGR02231 family)
MFYSSLGTETIFRLLSLCLTLAGAIAPVCAQEAIETSITDVVVYSDRARITRKAEVDLPAGASVLEFIGFPDGIETSSLEVRGTSGVAVTIEGIDVRNRFLAASANPRVQEVEQQLRSLEERKNGFVAQKAVLTEKRTFFNNLSAGLGRSDKGPMALDDVRALFVYYGEEVTKISEALLALELSERNLNPEFERLKRELESLQSAASKGQKRVLVSVKAAAASKAGFAIRYVVPGATWTPSYDARVDSSAGKVDLQYNAEVRQQTGEDWNNAGMILSTAQPARNGQMPELNPSEIDYLPERQPVAALAPAPMAARKDFTATPQEEAVSKMEVAQSEIEKTGLSVSFRVGLKVTIPSDGDPHRTNVTVIPLEGKPEYVTTPKLDSGVFLKLNLTNASDSPLLPGSMNLFRDGEFIGSMAMKWVQPGAQFDLYAGRDDALKVERKTLVNKRSESGLINRKFVEERRFQITVQNFRSAPIKISVNDQMPISRNAEIVVNQGGFSVQPVSIEKDSGKLTWNLDLNPKEKKVIEFWFSIEWPKGKEIIAE